MTALALPDVPFQISRPHLVDSVSVSRAGKRAISFVETADPFWQIAMRTIPLRAAELALVEAFGDAARTGRQTVLYTPKHVCLPQAYWGNPAAATLANPGNLVSITDGFSIAIDSVDNGLTLMQGDLISLTTGDYHSLHRIQTGAVAALNAISVTVEPYVPGYITAGAVVRFKDPLLNMRVLPGSFSVTDDYLAVASFTLVEVPK